MGKSSLENRDTHTSVQAGQGAAAGGGGTFQLLRQGSRANLPLLRPALKHECVLLNTKANNAFATSGSSEVKAISAAYVSVQTKNFQWPFFAF